MQTYGLNLTGAYDAFNTQFNAARERNKENKLKQLMGGALQGDQRKLAELAGQSPEAWMKVRGFTDDQKKAAVQKYTSMAYAAKTPQQWQQFVNTARAEGFEFDPGEDAFENRDQFIAQGFTAAEQMGFDLDRLKAANSGGANEHGLQPVWGTGPDGKPMLFQLNKGGANPRQVQFPEGFTPEPGVQFLDTGLGYIPANKRTGIPQAGAGVVPKDVAGAAHEAALGKDSGEAAALYASLNSKMPGLKKVVDELNALADQATYTQTGQAYNWLRKETGFPPTDAAVARAKYVAMVDNQVLPMLRDTFGSQFTVVEGESLRATLGDPNKTPAEKKAVLEAFIEQKVRNIEAAAIQGKVKQPQGGALTEADLPNAMQEAQEAIANGADPQAVIQELIKMGVDPTYAAQVAQ